MSLGGGGSGGSSSTTYTYPEWVRSNYERANEQVYEGVTAAKANNPFKHAPVDPAILIANWQKTDDWMDEQLYALDPKTLFDSLVSGPGSVPSSILGLVNRPEIREFVEGHTSQIMRAVEEEVLPKFRRGMQNIGAVNTSAFKIGEALIWSGHIRDLDNLYMTTVVNKLLDMTQSSLSKVQDDYMRKLEQSMQFYKMSLELEKAIHGAQSEYNSGYNEFLQAQGMWPVQLNKDLISAAGSWQASAASSQTKSKESQDPVSGLLSGVLGVASIFGRLF